MMIDTGGPAFPVQVPEFNNMPAHVNVGMTLRDYFAAKALQSMLGRGSLIPMHILADDSYLIADEMLKARNGNV